MVLVVGCANPTVYVPAGGAAPFDQPLLLESLDGTNGGVPGNVAALAMVW